MARDRPLYDGHNRQPGAAKRGRAMRNKRRRRSWKRKNTEARESFNKRRA